MKTMLIESRRSLFRFNLADVWRDREVLYFLVWRDFKVKYRQTLLGAAWVLLQPLMTLFVLSIVFGRLVRIPSEGIPYPVFAYAGLLPWTYFAQALGRSSTSIVYNSHLITRIYFPRLIIPLAAVVTPGLELLLSFGVLFALMLWYKIAATWALLTLPLFLALAFVLALGCGLWLSSINVRYRDVAHAVPFLIQVWMYASPIVYPTSLVPEPWRWLYGVNPMVGVIEGFRWALLGKRPPDLMLFGLSAAVITAVTVGGFMYFAWKERTFADVI